MSRFRGRAFSVERTRALCYALAQTAPLRDAAAIDAAAGKAESGPAAGSPKSPEGAGTAAPAYLRMDEAFARFR